MGTYSVAKQITSKMRSIDSLNPRALREWIRRVMGVAADLEKSDNAVKQAEFQTLVIAVAEEFSEASDNQPEDPSTLIAPEIFSKRRNILNHAEQRLDRFQLPLPGRSLAVQRAVSADEKDLGETLEGLVGSQHMFVKEVTGSLPAEAPSLHASTSHVKPDMKAECQPPECRMSQTFSLRNQERVQARFTELLAMYENGNGGEPQVMIGISQMGADGSDQAPHFIALDHNFSALADSVTNFDNDEPLPDFWSKQRDPEQNSVTPSGIWWEWQDPSKNVVDVIRRKNEDGENECLGIESVVKEGEYVVVLLKEDEMERGMPIDLPPKYRQPTSCHFQQVVFPNHKVSRVLQLRNGLDASHVIFDRRGFHPRTNSLFVEVQTGPEVLQQLPEKPDVAAVILVDGNVTDELGRINLQDRKGKGKERTKTGAEAI